MAKSTVESVTEVIVDLTEQARIQILHVDDEPGLLNAAKQILEMQGPFHVETAVSVEEALEKMKKKTFDVIVSDYVMPRKDGLGFLRELREEGNNIPFIIFTGKGREEVAIKALNWGADQYLNKGGRPETVYGELAHGIRKSVEARKAEVSLRESEKRFRSIVENSHDGIVMIDDKFVVIYANDEASRIIGYSIKEIVGQNFMEFLADESKALVKDRYLRRQRGEKVPSIYEFKVVRKDGRKRDVEIKSTVLRDNQGRVQTIAQMLDITEHKKAEERIKASEEKYRSIVELAPDSIMTFDLKGVITSCNTASTRLSGYSKDELVGKHFSKIGPIRARDIPKFLRLLPFTIRGKVSKPFEVTFQHKDGTTRRGEVHMSLMKVGGKAIGIQAIMRDITERKKTEEALRGNEEKFRNLAEQSPNMIYINKKGRIVYANKKCEEIMGYKREEFYSPDFNFLTLIAPEHIGLVKTNFSKHMKGEEVAQYEHALITKEGKRIEVIQSTKLIKHEGESAFLGIITDITERKKIFEELRSSEERLNILFEFAPDAYYLNDLKGNFVDGNKAAEELTGYNKSELIGKSFLKLKLLSRRQIPKAAKLLATNALGKPTGPDEFILNRKDGTQVPIEIRTYPIKIKL